MPKSILIIEDEKSILNIRNQSGRAVRRDSTA